MSRQLTKFVLICAIFFSQKSFAIINGKEMSPLEKPEVIRLLLFTTDDSGKVDPNLEDSCSGVAISDSLVLTAGHCVAKADHSGNYKLALHRFLKNGIPEVIFATNAYTEYIPEDLQKLIDEQNKGAIVPGCVAKAKPIIETKTPDIALVRFPSNTFSKWANINATKHLDVNDSVQFYGYGIVFEGMPTMPEPSMLDFREGTNIIWRTSEQRIAFISPHHESIAQHGDSGAPVFNNGELVALVSSVEEKCETQYGDDYAIMNTATILSSEQAHSFLNTALIKLK